MSTESGSAVRTNALTGETSPYLLQHAHNPVEWYPWCPEALQRARAEDKPILLSIGYSACHWCHVMAHESFEDPATAALMNELYVNIKVDREERPDLDRIYQQAHHLLTQRTGGWPLTMFLTPDNHAPFFGGTYFPREPRHGLPSFSDLLRRVAGVYREQGDEIRKQNDFLRQAFERMHDLPGAADIDGGLLQEARRQLEQAYDPRHCGFGQAPKFPHPTNIERLLRHWAASARSGEEDTRALEMARLTLHAMASGGIYDQLGGGFCRYSVDDYWMIPHFEKMLYDNGPLLALYADAWAATGDGVFRRVVQETADWVIREMQSPAGGYYSTLDADSSGMEGGYYLWTPEEVQAHLDAGAYEVFAHHYGLDRAANFEGRWHLHVFQPLTAIARELDQSADEVAMRLQEARRILLTVRTERDPPGRDEKILTAWNGLMIRGMAAAGRRLREPAYTASAERALDFIRTTLWRDGRLYATTRDGHTQLMAYLDDHAFLIAGILELLQVRWRAGDLEFAMDLADVMLAHFEDHTQGGFFFTADDHEQLLHRPKPFMDEAIPAGNGIAAWVLGRLGHLLGEVRYLKASERTLKAAAPLVKDIPYAHNALLLAVEEYLEPVQSVVLRGSPEAMQEWLERCDREYTPARITMAIPAGAVDLPGILAERRLRGEVVAYVCNGTACLAPVTSLAELDKALGGA